VRNKGNDAKNGWCLFENKVLIFTHQSEGEAGNAGEQPASNRIDAYTIKRQSANGCLFYLSVCVMAKKNSKSISKVEVPFYKIFSMLF
jgi:hypothetical protein